MKIAKRNTDPFNARFNSLEAADKFMAAVILDRLADPMDFGAEEPFEVCDGVSRTRRQYIDAQFSVEIVVMQNDRA